MNCFVKDLTGKTFGNLTVIGFAGTDKHRKALWRVRNKYGDISVVRGAGLITGSNKGRMLRVDSTRVPESVPEKDTVKFDPLHPRRGLKVNVHLEPDVAKAMGDRNANVNETINAALRLKFNLENPHEKGTRPEVVSGGPSSEPPITG